MSLEPFWFELAFAYLQTNSITKLMSFRDFTMLLSNLFSKRYAGLFQGVLSFAYYAIVVNFSSNIVKIGYKPYFGYY